MPSIQQTGGLKQHMEGLGLNYTLFALMAEANWDKERRMYLGVRTMARTLSVTPTTIMKYLKVYDTETGRQRHEQNKKKPGVL